MKKLFLGNSVFDTARRMGRCSSSAFRDLGIVLSAMRDPKVALPSTCEYSLGKDGHFKFLDLFFYSSRLDNVRREEFGQRKDQIRKVFACFKDRAFDSGALERFLSFSTDINFPLQAAFEFDQDGLCKIKIYVSNIHRLSGNFSGVMVLVNKMLPLMRLHPLPSDLKLDGEGIDAVGFDFSKDGRISLKIYTYFHQVKTARKCLLLMHETFQKNEVSFLKQARFSSAIRNKSCADMGFLYRFSADGRVAGVKCWYRLLSADRATYHGFKVSYLTYENGFIGRYLRSKWQDISWEHLQRQNDFFRFLTNKISETDFAGYTIQYPPMCVWPPAEGASVRPALSKISRRDRLGIYLHIPFCDQKCTFCRYFSEEKPRQQEIQSYVEALKKEMLLYGPALRGRVVESLYIGGGTPSVLSIRQLEELFSVLYQTFRFSDDAQKCIEVNPSSVTKEKLKTLRDCGIDRLTIGVQSLSQAVLQAVGRKQTPQMALQCLRWAREIGFPAVNIDLMAGLPGETLNSFTSGFRRLMALRPDMVHVHPFYPTKNTRFFQEQGDLPDTACKHREQMSAWAAAELSKAGYRGIRWDANGLSDLTANRQLADAVESVSSFVGLGAGAVSHIRSGERYVNEKNISRYMQMVADASFPISAKISLTKKDEMIYYITACLRYGPVDKKAFRSLFKEDIADRFGPLLLQMKSLGFLEENDREISLRGDRMKDYVVFSKYFFDRKIFSGFDQEFDGWMKTADRQMYL